MEKLTHLDTLAMCSSYVTDGPVTLLRMRATYELRMKIHKIIFIRTKKTLEIQNCAFTYRIEPMSNV